MTQGMGIDGTFLLFAAFCMIGLFYILFFVPETKGKTLEEIQEGFATVKSAEPGAVANANTERERLLPRSGTGQPRLSA